MRHFLASVDYPEKDYDIVGHPDGKIVGQASHVLHQTDHILATSLHPDQKRG